MPITRLATVPTTSSGLPCAAMVTFNWLGMIFTPNSLAKSADMAADPGTVLPVSTSPKLVGFLVETSRLAACVHF